MFAFHAPSRECTHNAARYQPCGVDNLADHFAGIGPYLVPDLAVTGASIARQAKLAAMNASARMRYS